jgi:DNA-binding transcriptional MerR regulator
MDFVSIESLCHRTGLTLQQVENFEAKGLTTSVTKGERRFYSMHEVYRVKGILYLMRTWGMSPEEASKRMESNPSEVDV